MKLSFAARVTNGRPSPSRSATQAAEGDRGASRRRRAAPFGAAFRHARGSLGDHLGGREAAAHSDVLRSGRLDGAVDEARSRGSARGHRRLSPLLCRRYRFARLWRDQGKRARPSPSSTTCFGRGRLNPNIDIRRRDLNRVHRAAGHFGCDYRRYALRQELASARVGPLRGARNGNSDG